MSKSSHNEHYKNAFQKRTLQAGDCDSDDYSDYYGDYYTDYKY